MFGPSSRSASRAALRTCPSRRAEPIGRLMVVVAVLAGCSDITAPDLPAMVADAEAARPSPQTPSGGDELTICENCIITEYVPPWFEPSERLPKVRTCSSSQAPRRTRAALHKITATQILADGLHISTPCGPSVL